MNRILTAAGLCAALSLIPAMINGKSIPLKRNKYKIGNAVILTGFISTSVYLSKTDNSKKEYFNTAYNLRLEKSINITDDRDGLKQYKNISHIEIENPFEYGMQNLKGRKVTVKGFLNTFSEHRGYYRQYSTPVKMEVIKIDIKD